MAIWKDKTKLDHSDSPEFDKDHKPGQPAPHSGIYHCMGCRREVASNEGQPLPPQNHHQHGVSQGAVRWRMIVYADHDPK